MPTSIQSHVHSVTQIVRFFERHKLETGLLVLAILAGSVVFTFSPLTLYKLLIPSAQTPSSKFVVPLTYIEDPQYAGEVEQRAQYITMHLERLRTQIQADKAYVMSYRYVRSQYGIVVFISKTFEVGKADFTAPAENYTGLSRLNWLIMTRYNSQTATSLTVPVHPPAGDGLELHDLDGRAIAYLGVTYSQEKPAISGEIPELLQHTATVIQAGFLQPIDELKDF